MSLETFEIRLDNKKDPGKYFRVMVDIIFRSEQLIRFKVYAGNKSMIMEKILTKKTGQWKVKEMNFQFSGDVKDIAQSILEMQNDIDYYLKGRPKPVNKYQNKP